MKTITHLILALALLAGVLGAARSGRGCDLDISLFDVALAQLTYPATWYLNAGHVVQRVPRSGHPSTVPCELVRTADGWLFVMCMTPKFWEALAHGVGRAQWLADSRFTTVEARRDNRAALSALMDQTFGQHSSAWWMERLAGKLPVAPVLNLPQALDNPFVQRVGMVQALPHPQAPQQRVLGNPVRVNGQRLPGRVCSALGADTDTLLDAAGYTPHEIEQLRQQGVV